MLPPGPGCAPAALAIGFLVLLAGAPPAAGSKENATSSCPLSYSEALRTAQGAWSNLLKALGDQVELLPFEDTIMQAFHHRSLRNSLRPVYLLEGTEVSGLRSGEVAVRGVRDNDSAVLYTVRMRPLKIRGALQVGEETHMFRCFLVDTTFRFETLPGPGDTVYALGRAGHMTSVQVANGDRTETAFGQDVEALLAGAAVTSLVHELQRAANIHRNWRRERAKQLDWAGTQVPRSWGDYGRIIVNS